MDTTVLVEFMKNNQVADQWWLAIDGKIIDAPIPISEIERLGRELPKARMHALHVSKAEGEEPVWDEVQFQSKPARKSKQERTISPEAEARISHLEVKVELLQHTLDAMIHMLHELDSFDALRQMLDERATFINQSEEALIAQTFEIEERAAELEQKREDLGMED